MGRGKGGRRVRPEVKARDPRARGTNSSWRDENIIYYEPLRWRPLWKLPRQEEREGGSSDCIRHRWLYLFHSRERILSLSFSLSRSLVLSSRLFIVLISFFIALHAAVRLCFEVGGDDVKGAMLSRIQTRGWDNFLIITEIGKVCLLMVWMVHSLKKCLPIKIVWIYVNVFLSNNYLHTVFRQINQAYNTDFGKDNYGNTNRH